MVRLPEATPCRSSTIRRSCWSEHRSGGDVMELSARNQLRGTVKQVRTEGIMAEVVIDLGGQEVVATITKASADRLKLKKGDGAVAIIKASDVLGGK